MKALLLPIGILAWAVVAAISVWMASIDESVLGFIPIIVSVFVAWAVGEFVTDVLWKEDHNA